MKKTKALLLLTLITIPLILPRRSQAQLAQGWVGFGTTINQKQKQNEMSFNTKFNPDIELGIRFPGESVIGGSFTANFRFINIEKLDWFNKKSTKFVYDCLPHVGIIIDFGI